MFLRILFFLGIYRPCVISWNNTQCSYDLNIIMWRLNWKYIIMWSLGRHIMNVLWPLNLDRVPSEQRVQWIKAATGSVLLKKVLLKILQISQETPVLESLFNKVAGLQSVSCAFCKIFMNTFFNRTPPVAASHMIWSKSKVQNHSNPLKAKSQITLLI